MKSAKKIFGGTRPKTAQPKIVPALLLTVCAATISVSAKADEAPKALIFDAGLTTDLQSNVQGGLKTGSRATKNLDLSVAYQGANGWETFGYIIANEGGGLSASLSGDTQGVTNIDAPKGVRLLEAWVKKTNAAQTLSLQVGAININSVFDVNDNGAVFLNPSQGLGPDVAQAAPSAFPVTSIGAISELTLSDSKRISIGVFDAQPGDPNQERAFATFNYSGKEGLKWLLQYQQGNEHNRFKVGLWHNSVKADRIDGLGKADNSGAYALLQSTLTRENDHSDQGLKAFARIGYANEDVQPIAAYAGAGLSYQGLFGGRDDDVAGIAFANIRFGKAYRAFVAGPLATETTFEITYQAQLKPGLVLQPDVQYIRHPSGDVAVKDALVVGIRLRVGLEVLH
jgi:porin